MNILLVFPGFIVAFIIVLCYERKVRDLSAKTKNNVRFYVARDGNDSLWLYLGKPERSIQVFWSSSCGEIIASDNGFSKYGLDVKDYANLKWEDEPVEVFLNLED